jgi:hypothetical protein
MNALTSADGSMRYSVLFISCVWLVAGVFTLPIKYEYKRLNAEIAQQALRDSKSVEVEDVCSHRLFRPLASCVRA